MFTSGSVIGTGIEEDVIPVIPGIGRGGTI
jgi:hypothetical protein